MSTTAGAGRPILEALGALRTAWPSPEWTWDARLDCATSSFETALVPRVRAALTPVLAHEWSAESLATAPSEVEALARQAGGLRAGQLLFSGEAAGGLSPFALWWPWGDGAKVSVRLGIAAADRPPDLTRQLRAVFGLA